MKKVLLGMSGGVDSAVAAIILKEKGYDVTGVLLQLYKNIDVDSVKSVCDEVGIPLIVIDAKEDFDKFVIDDFIDKYQEGKTPSPCIECNKYLKFKILYDKCIELNYDFIATGHYAKVEYSEKYNRNVLKKAVSIEKDQSYFLYSINNNIIDKLIFPLAGFNTKEEIRNIALKHNLSVAKKGDSQDVCFIDTDYIDFLEDKEINSKPGNIVDEDNNIIGKHDGLYKYTIGQRKGIETKESRRLYVNHFDCKNNNLCVGSEDKLYGRNLVVNNLNLLAIDEIIGHINIKAKVRSTGIETDAILYIEDNIVKVSFIEPKRAITSGQSVVFYDGDIVIGGGEIA